MDKDFSSVRTQYIICECGDNFPNETFLSAHLANDHGEVDTFLCDVCPEAFTSDKLLVQHKLTHKPETPKKPDLKPQKSLQVTVPVKKEKMEKKPPVIKVQNLKKIDTISLIQSLKTYGRFIKLDPEPPEPPETVPIVVERVEEPTQVLVKKEEVEADAEDDAEEIYYQCDVCNAIFYTEMDFNVHYQSEHALKQELPPTAEQILADHLATDHADHVDVQASVETVYYYECEVCHKIFANEKYFNIHYNKVHGGLLPVAEEPEYKGAHSQPDDPSSEPDGAAPALALEDVKPKAPEQVVYYKCDLCKILYPSEKAYNTHFDKKHGQSCQELQSAGFRYIEQDLSQEYRPAAGAELFSCEFCSKSFNVKRSLAVHRKRVHVDLVKVADGLADSGRAASRSKVCDICGRAYNSNAALRYHQRRHTGEKPYACSVCPKRFTMPMFLQIHTRTHTGEKPYECPHCPKAFTNKAALIRHDRVHSGVKPYPCPECGKLFTQSNSMKLHVSTVHLKLPAPYKSKSRRSKSEARALQQALKGLADPPDTLILGE